MIKIDPSHPMNRGILDYLNRDPREKRTLSASPESVRDPYYGQGSHPEVVERVWDQLGGPLPRDCRCLAYGTPVLADPKNGVIFAACCGTQYALRLTPADLLLARVRGLRTTTRWSDGGEMDTRKTVGADWVFGEWQPDEIRWCANIYALLEDETAYAR
jgi:hypothetical protein